MMRPYAPNGVRSYDDHDKTMMCMYAILYLALMAAKTNLFLSFCLEFRLIHFIIISHLV